MSKESKEDPTPPKKRVTPQLIQDAAKKMAPGSQGKPHSSSSDQNSLIVRPGESNRSHSRSSAVKSSLPKRMLPGEIPESVIRQRQRLNELRTTLAAGVSAVDHFIGTSKRLITELKNLKGGEDAAIAEGVDLTEVAQSIETIEAAMNKAFPAAEEQDL